MEFDPIDYDYPPVGNFDFMELPSPPALVRTDYDFDIAHDATIPDEPLTFNALFVDSGEILEDGRRVFELNKEARKYIRINRIACVCDTCYHNQD